MENRRRSADRRAGDRRQAHDRRLPFARYGELSRTPAWPEQRAQYLTRLLFWALGMAYFNLGVEPRVEPLATNLVLTLYGAVHLIGFWHARRRLYCPWRWRLAGWVDLVFVTYSIYADPAVPSPGFLVYIVVILGNGMRYGLKAFAESVAGCFVMAMVALVWRYSDYLDPFNPSTLLFLAFGALLVIYSYTLMARVEQARRQLEVERGLDELTGLMNRRAFHERAEPLFNALSPQDEPAVVLFADLDGFKRINDTHGHAFGDQVLAAIAGIVASGVRRGDLLARYGGDEFVLMMPATRRAGAEIIAARIKDRIESWSRERGIELSVSMGLEEFPQPDCDFRTALSRVDQAMYRNKPAAALGKAP